MVRQRVVLKIISVILVFLPKERGMQWEKETEPSP